MRQLSRIIMLGCALFFFCTEIFSQVKYFDIYADGNIKLLLVDPSGRKLGYDPHTKTHFEDIPNSSIGAAGIDIISDDGEPESNESQSNPVEANVDDIIEGQYQIIVSGNSLSFFSLQFRTRYNNKGKTYETGGIIDSLQTIVFKFTFKTTPELIFEVERIVTSTALRQDFDNSYKLSLIGKTGFYKELANYLDNYEKHLAKKDTLKALQEVEQFQSKLKKEYLEANINDKRFITEDAWNILNADVQYIVGHLITLPQKSQGALLQQIDELKDELQAQNAKKNIGGALLVKSLSALCGQAKKELSKKDSTGAGFDISLFQLAVAEINTLTNEIEGKRRKFTALFVNDEAYIALYYRAKYIIEALPQIQTRFDLTTLRLDNDVRRELQTMKKMAKEK